MLSRVTVHSRVSLSLDQARDLEDVDHARSDVLARLCAIVESGVVHVNGQVRVQIYGAFHAERQGKFLVHSASRLYTTRGGRDARAPPRNRL